VAGGGGTGKTVNHPTVARTADGAIIERDAPSVVPSQSVQWQLRRADFTTAVRIADAINKQMAPNSEPVAVPESAGVVKVTIPPVYRTRPVQFIAEMENVTLDSDGKARVVVNERTGTIVLGGDIRISPVTIMHGTLSVEVQTAMAVSQPNAFSSGGSTQVVPQVNVNANEEKAKNLSLPKGATVESLVKGLSAIGATPRDILSVLQSMKAAGALAAEVEII
jgi:flagellar P-ring protein precursor FlgI